MSFEITEQNPTCEHGYIGGIGCSTCTKAREEFEQAQRSAAYEAKQKAEREQQEQRYSIQYHAIASRFPPERKVQIDGRKMTVDGINTSYIFEMREQRTSGISGWHMTPTGKWQITVGDYGQKKVYPQRKDGTFNYADIAAALLYYVNGKLAQNLATATASNNKDEADKFCTEMGLKEYYGPMTVGPSSVTDKPIFVKVKIERAMTYEEAAALHAALKSAGVLS